MKNELVLSAGAHSNNRLPGAQEVSASSKPRFRVIRKIFLLLLGIVAFIAIWLIYMRVNYKKMYEIREPRVENEQSILMTAGKYGLNTTNIVTVAPEDFNGLFKQFGNSLPEALIFDKQGNYIEYKATDKSCNAGLFGFIPGLEKNGRYKMTGKVMLNTEMSKLRDLQGSPLPQTYLDPTADYYIMISWVAWIGKMNKEHLHVWEDLAAKNTKAKIQVIAVNFDAQQWWPDAANDSVLKKFSKI